MAAGDIFKLTLNSRISGQEMANVFHYRQTIGVLGGEQLASSWVTEVFDDIRLIISNTCVFVDVTWINYNDLGDFGVNTDVAGIFGNKAGEALPMYNAWAFQYNRETRVTRNGSKRFSGIVEADQSLGVALPGVLPELDSVASSLGQLINFGGTEWWEPVIARIPPGATAPTVINGVRDVTYKRITTQNSRKPW